MAEYIGTIVENSDITIETYILKILLDKELNHRAGQFINIDAVIDGERRIKAYSITSVPEEKNRVELCIKKIPGGKMSNYLYNIPIGTKLKITGPYGFFICDGNNDTIFIATGTGVAGIKPIVESLLSNGCEKKITLVYGVRKEEDVYYRDVFENLAKKYNNFSFITTLSRPRPTWKGLKGYVQEWVKNHVKYTGQEDVYICGLPDMVEEIIDICKSLGFSENKIHAERYV
ncbi:MAG: FAD-dependent oxidoreductase [Candidatus Aenigmatarchaeota archaeon]